MDPPDNTQWTRPAYISPAIRSQFSPQIIGYGSAFYCFWVKKGKSEISYLIQKRQTGSNDHDWLGSATPSLITFGPEFPPEIASQTPALAFFCGQIHVVFCDEMRYLTHVRFDPVEQTWGHRCTIGPGAVTGTSPSLTVFREKIYCVYTILDSTQPLGKIVVQTWDMNSGWEKFPKVIASSESLTTDLPIALFELNDLLHVYAIQRGDSNATASIFHYQNDGGELSDWEQDEIILRPEGLLGDAGISGCAVNDIGFLAFVTQAATQTPRINIFLLNTPSTWSQPTTQSLSPSPEPSSKSYPRVPQIANIGNTLMCIWVNKDEVRFQYSTRRIWNIPVLSRWMSQLPDDQYISNLTIPGTHDSAAISYNPVVNTQSMNIREQLESGIRYLDIRAGFSEFNPGVLIAYHGFVGIRKSFGLRDYLEISAIFQDCYDFLDIPENENECIIIQIKQDYEGFWTDTGATVFADAVMSLIKTKETYWRLDCTLPKLRDLRGRIQLVRRFKGIVLDAESTSGIYVWPSWPDNSGLRFSTQPKDKAINVDFVVQDFWKWSEFNVCEEKFKHVLEYLELCRKDKDPKVWYLNFASATAPTATIFADQVAMGWRREKHYMGSPGINNMLADFFNKHDSRALLKSPSFASPSTLADTECFGTVLMDFPESQHELILGLIRCNFPVFNSLR